MASLRRVWLVFWVLMLSVSLSACGGGGSGGAARLSAPAGLKYSSGPAATYVAGTQIHDNTASSTGGTISSYKVSPPLPNGLHLDTSTGTISGTPTTVTASASYVITGSNSVNSTTTTLTITVNAGIGGTVSGLAGSGLVLQNNSGDNLTITGNGSFTFPNSSLASGAAYAVTVLTPPSNPAQICTVTNGSGTVSTTSITTVTISCSSGWTWEGGAKTVHTAGIYSVASGTLTPGGRHGAAGWTDSNGRFWLFGGNGIDSKGNQGNLNDVWTYDPIGKTWTFAGGSTTVGAKGIYTSTNGTLTPGARDSATSWTDSSGRFWLFGGEGYDSAGAFGYLNDVWMYDPSTETWTFEGGSTTAGAPGVYSGTNGTLTPGARFGATGWTDSSGRFWLFGGFGTTGDFNDLWMYDPIVKTWTFEGGSTTVDAAGVYNSANGTLTPGARWAATGWTDSSGRFWLFGGDGYDSTGTLDSLNDVWMYDPTAKTWTFEGGSTTVDATGVYNSANGTLTPGARVGATGWTDSSGRFWLFGGEVYNSGATYSGFNDVWMYDPTAKAWTFESGSTSVNASGGIYTSTNGNITPGTRWAATGWTDSSGKLWLFGGNGYDSADNSGDLNDLWQFQP